MEGGGSSTNLKPLALMERIVSRQASSSRSIWIKRRITLNTEGLLPPFRNKSHSVGNVSVPGLLMPAADRVLKWPLASISPVSMYQLYFIVIAFVKLNLK